MGKDFALTASDREKVMAAPPIKTPAEIEAEIIANERIETATKALGQKDADDIDRRNRSNFRIRDGAVLPEKFINGDPGEDDHLCVDNAGIYHKDWFQVYIIEQHEGQENPQPFYLGSIIRVPLEKWVDVPPEVIQSLKDAVEIHHRLDFKPGDIVAGRPAVHEQTTRRRFNWDHKRSA